MSAEAEPKPESDPPLTPLPAPPIQWGKTSSRLGALALSNSLPMVVTCDVNFLPSLGNIHFDFSQPLYLHSKRTVRKVLASNLHLVKNDKGTWERQEVGDRLLIPEDYKGWFAVLGPAEKAISDKPEIIQHYTNVGYLAMSKCQSFLIGGNESVNAVRVNAGDSLSSCRVQPRVLYPGDVLRMGSLYSAETTVRVKTGMFGGKKSMKKLETFLLCIDEEDREVYIPVNTRGIFYVLTREGQVVPPIPILKMPDICTHYRFPCVVKLLYGRVPASPCPFTGTLILLDSQIESSVIACTVLNKRNILLEMPIDTDLRFMKAEPTPELLTSQAYKNAQRLCLDKATTYMRNMKVQYHMNTVEANITPPLTRQSNFSDKTPSSLSFSGSYSSTESLQDNKSLLVRKMSQSTPCIVEEQELFDSRSSISQPSKLSNALNGSSRKSKSARQNNIKTEDITITDSPTVLRKLPTFDLPATPEVLPIAHQRSASVPSLSSEGRPLPPIQQQPATSTNHYVTVDEETALTEQTLRSTPVSKKNPPPVPPPKPVAPPKPVVQADCDSTVDLNEYDRAWVGNNLATVTTVKKGLVTEQTKSPAVNDVGSYLEMNAAKIIPPSSDLIQTRSQTVSPDRADRASSIVLADTYLTLPVFRTDLNSATTVSTPVMTSIKPPESPYIPMTPPSSYQNRSQLVTSVTASQDVDLPSRPPRCGSGTDLPNWKYSDESEKVLPSQPRVSSESESPDYMAHWPRPSQSTDESEKILSPQRRVSSESESPGYMAHWPRPSQNTGGISLHRDSSFTYSETCSPKRPSHLACPKFLTEQEEYSANSVSQTESDEVLYENFENLKIHKEPFKFENPEVMENDDLGSPRPCSINFQNSLNMLNYIDPLSSSKNSSFGEMYCQSGNSSLQDTDFHATEHVHFENSVPSLPPSACQVRMGNHSSPYLTPVEEHKDFIKENSAETISRASSADDLPLGATYATYIPKVPSDSGCWLESVAEESNAVRKDSGVASLSVLQLLGELQKIGLKKNSLDRIRAEKIDGRLLVSLVQEDELKAALPKLPLIDVTKLRMFVNGWRPKE